MRRTLLTAAIIICVSALLPAAAVAGYGAIAWDKATGKYGWSRNQSSAQKADELALAGCGASGCEVVVRMTSAALCGALATTKDRKAVGAASRKTAADARLAALADCRKSTDGECVIRTSGCTK
jgi:hypothetical protein